MQPLDYAGRMRRIRGLMADRGVDALLLSVGADLPYFTGYEAPLLERLTMLVVPRGGEAVLVVPELEAPRVVAHPEVFATLPWSETEDPVSIVAERLGGARRAAIGDQTWSTFLLGLQDRLPDTRFEPAGSLTAELRMRKDPEEIDRLRRAARATDRVVARLRDMRFSGLTERALAIRVGELTLEEGHQRIGFSIVAAGENAASPHHEPTDRMIETGDCVVIDFGGSFNGYHSDTTRTFHVGQPGASFTAAYRVLQEAQAAATAVVRPGIPAEQVDRSARQIIAGAGYGKHFVHRTGHGIGTEVHEHPYIVDGNPLPLEPGMAFSVEPGIYVAGVFGMRIEDIVVVTETGADSLNRSPRELAIVA